MVFTRLIKLVKPIHLSKAEGLVWAHIDPHEFRS